MKSWYVADFETTDINYYKKNGYTKVWLYAICDENGVIVNWGKTIDEFMNWLHKNPKIDIYFHNLKFDGSFILNYLLNNKFEYKDRLKVKDNKGFSTLIGEEGQYYQIKINFARNKQITIYDSLKLMPLKVKELAKVFNMEIEKGEIDYSDYTINDTTLEYVFNDVRIVAKALKYFKDKGFNKMTIGSNSYNLFKSTVKYYEQLFPALDKELLIEWRKAYRGGRTQVNPRYKDKIVHNIKRYDINSMYPYAMSRFPMPYGQPIECDTKGKYKFEIYKVDISFKLKKGHLPTLLKSGTMFASQVDTYYKETEGIETIYISNIDYLLLKRHYDIDFIKVLKIWGFKTNRYLFTSFIDKYYELKNTSKGGMRLLYKLIINNLYGKYGSKVKGKTRIPHLENEALTFDTSEEKDLTLYYLPVAIAITSWCHKILDDAIELIGVKNFVYCDTDSVHSLIELPKEMVDNKEIGKFKLEGIENIAKYVRQKCYVYKEDTHYNITCAGMTEGLKDYLIREYCDDVFDVFKVGLKLGLDTPNIKVKELKLRPIQVKGGTILVPTEFSLN